MSGARTDKKDDEAKFNETLKRMLNSPPKPRSDKVENAPAKRATPQKKAPKSA